MNIQKTLRSTRSNSVLKTFDLSHFSTAECLIVFKARDNKLSICKCHVTEKSLSGFNKLHIFYWFFLLDVTDVTNKKNFYPFLFRKSKASKV